MSVGRCEWMIVIHWDATHTSPPLGPYGATEAEQEMRKARARYRAAGKTPPKMQRILIKSRACFDAWTSPETEKS